MTTSCLESCLAKQRNLKQMFALCKTSEEKYQKIINLGKSLPPFPEDLKLKEFLVPGCQSAMYLHASLSEDQKILFIVDSEALISKGLAALLISIYNEEPPEVLLTCPPSCLEEIGIRAHLSPSRSNGLSSIYLKMRQTALSFLKTSTQCKNF